jgi:hypothetical protein
LVKDKISEGDNGRYRDVLNSYKVKNGFDENVDNEAWRKRIGRYDYCLKEELKDDGQVRVGINETKTATARL